MDEKDDRYPVALKIAFNEGKILWDSSQVFLLSNTILGAFIAQAISKDISKDWKIFTSSLIGIVITFIWYASYQRRSHYYKFRMAQVRKLEPVGWNLIAGDGLKFSQGAEVEVEGKYYRLPLLARLFTTDAIIQLVIALFGTGFIILAIISRTF